MADQTFSKFVLVIVTVLGVLYFMYSDDLPASKIDIVFQLRNINTGGDAVITDYEVTAGGQSSVLPEEFKLVERAPAVEYKREVVRNNFAAVSGQFKVTFRDHGFYIVKFGVPEGDKGLPWLQLEDHTTPARLISEQHEEPKIFENTFLAKIQFMILV